VWSFRLASFCRCQNNFEGIFRVQCYRLRKRSMIREPGQLMLAYDELADNSSATCLSLKPDLATETMASSKFHDEAASATPAPKSSNEGSNERKNRIVEVVLCNV
jgi:hypothetical protein